MSLRFDDVHLPPLAGISLSFEDGTIAGLAGPDGSGKSLLLQLAVGRIRPEKGRVEASTPPVLVEIGARGASGARKEVAAAVAANPQVLFVDHALSMLDEVAKLHAIQQLYRLRRRGSVIVVSSHDLPLLERLCDVVVALEDGRVVEQGDPGLVLANYRRRMTERARVASGVGEVHPTRRRGDRRAEICSIEIAGEAEAPTSTIRSGESVTVSAKIRFHENVENPVAGMLIRNRVGVTVYGTNTELEQAPIGSRRAGETVVVEFRFRCDLCPQEYTLTVASHDPDGTQHDWLEEAVLFSVIDSRYTAGVANLRAEVRISGQ